jgi:DNA polymerase I-like protein with 3'-5' exonuclease and polymerase domains
MEEVTTGLNDLKVVHDTDHSPAVPICFVPGSKTVIEETDAVVIDAAIKYISSSRLKAVTLDLEGVDLCRVGPVCIVTIGVKDEMEDDSIIFIFDTLNLTKSSCLISKLRVVLEDEDIIKIIHDCKMDSDALHHQYDIKLTNVHDTQVWEKITTSAPRGLNLNDTLSKNGCKPNTFRDGSVYKTNPKFWMTRPLTQKMIDWAAEDVASLFVLQSKQVAKAKNIARCKLASEEALNIRDKVHSLVEVANVGRFIGRNGSNINSLTQSLSTHGAEFQRINPDFGKRENFVVYANDAKALEIVIARVRKAGAD